MNKPVGCQGLSLSFLEKLATQRLELSGEALKKSLKNYLLNVGHVLGTVLDVPTYCVSFIPHSSSVTWMMMVMMMNFLLHLLNHDSWILLQRREKKLPIILPPMSVAIVHILVVFQISSVCLCEEMYVYLLKHTFKKSPF